MRTLLLQIVGCAMRTLLLQIVGCAMRTLLLQIVGCAMRTLLQIVGCAMRTLLLQMRVKIENLRPRLCIRDFRVVLLGIGINKQSKFTHSPFKITPN